MSLQKLSLSLVLSISVLLAACGGSQNKDKSAERTQNLAIQTLNGSVDIESGDYTITAKCLDDSKNAGLTNYQWTISFKNDGSYLYSETNLDPKCTENCILTSIGTYKLTKLQMSLNFEKVLNSKTNSFDNVDKPLTENLTVLSNTLTTTDGISKRTLTLLDESTSNICKGRMTWVMTK